MAFNVKVLPDAQEESEISHIKLFEDKVIYSLIDNYNAWVEEDSTNEEECNVCRVKLQFQNLHL